MDNNIKDAIELIYNLGKLNREIKPFEVQRRPDTPTAALVPEGLRLINVDEMIPDHPRYKSESRNFIDLASFVAYVNEQKNDCSRIFGQIREEPYIFDAVIDYHGTADGPANLCKHHAVLELTLSREFSTWYSINDKMMPQTDFAEFLKDNRLDIVSPDNATVLGLVMELQATSESRCVGKVPTNAGMAFNFEETTTASRNGQKIDVPNQIVLNMPVFDGMGNESITLDFKFRVQSGTLFFGIRMIGVERMMRNALLAARNQIAEKTSLPVYL